MTIDVYEDHIRFLGYHVPLDTSKLPATTRDALVTELQGGVDAVEDGTEASAISEAFREGSDEGAKDERERIMDAISERLERAEEALAALREAFDALEPKS